MQSKDSTRHFVIAFFIAVAIYVVAYNFIEGRRHRKGPWEVTFSSDGTSSPELIISQTNLNISGARIVFTHGHATPTNCSIRFEQPKEPPFPAPFGDCLFQDILFLPGTVALKLFGHEIQLMPRTLTIDKVERRWQTNLVVSLEAQ